MIVPGDVGPFRLSCTSALSSERACEDDRVEDENAGEDRPRGDNDCAGSTIYALLLTFGAPLSANSAEQDRQATRRSQGRLSTNKSRLDSLSLAIGPVTACITDEELKIRATEWMAHLPLRPRTLSPSPFRID